MGVPWYTDLQRYLGCFQFFDTTYSAAVHFLLFFANVCVRNCLTVELPGQGNTRFIFYYILPTVLQRGNI